MSTEIAPRPSAFRRPLTWAVPVVVVSVLMSLLAALYLGGVADPQKNLRHFPLALVQNDEGDVLPNGQQANLGASIADGIEKGLDADRFDLRVVGIAQAQEMLANGDVYAAVVIPSDFTKRVTVLAEAAAVPGDVEKPIVTVMTNPRAGTLGSTLASTVADRALAEANSTVGSQLVDQVTAGLPEGTVLTGTAAVTLAQPIDVVVAPYDPLPDGTGLGLSAFYYALLLVLAGFTGATIANALVDGAIGYLPLEYGPFFRQKPAVPVSRLRTLVAKWLTMVVVGAVVSGLYLAIAAALGMPTPHALLLWLYGALAISAVGITAMSVVAVLGTPGLVINLVLFVILGLPSAGATIPLEATPRLFGFLATFEPMHQVYLAVRAILYFDGRWSAGLAHGLTMTLIGLALGLAVGAAVAALYDRRGRRRAVTAPSARGEAVGTDD